MTNEIVTTEVQDWTSRTLETFNGNQIDKALSWINETITNELLQEYDIQDFQKWLEIPENNEIYESYHDEFYVVCLNENGEEMPFEY